MSIDRDAIVSAILDGAGIVAETPISPASPFRDASSAPAVAHDPETAAGLLKAAGWTRGTAGWRQPKDKAVATFTVDTLDTATNPTLNAVATRVVADWTAFGLQPTLQGYGAAQLVEGRLLVDEFEVAVIEINLGLDPDLFPLLASSQAVQGGTNVAGYQSTKLDALLAAARDQADPETRRTRFAALEARLAEELPFLTLHFGQRVELLRERVQGPSAREISASSERFWDVLAWHLAGTPDP
jgi:peptide/nickel transport system substrate-binding protein